MRQLTKKQKKHLRVLAEKAYEVDLGRSIDKLFEKYHKWKDQKISVWDMNQWIHKYHDVIARDLYKSYTIDDPISPVAFGIDTGAIDISEVNKDCLEEVKNVLDYLEKR